MCNQRGASLAWPRNGEARPGRDGPRRTLWLALGLVPVVGQVEGPCRGRRSVAFLDVVQAPADLRLVVGLPVGAFGRHLFGRKRLPNAVSATGGVGGSGAPIRFLVPQGDQGRHFALAPTVGGKDACG